MKNHHAFSALFAFALIAAGCSSCPASAQVSCQPVFDALTKIVTTPSHSYTTTTAAFRDHGKPRESETIYVDGKMFVRVTGQWTPIKTTLAEVLEQEKENRQNGKASCQAVRSDSVNGEAVNIYSIQAETEVAKETGQLWISKSTGRVLREDQETDLGGSEAKVHRSSRYEYNNVRPPM